MGWILVLSPTGVALLLILMELQGGHTKPCYVPKYRRLAYGISSDTWTRARKELESYELLTMHRIPQGGDFDYRLLRNAYWINIERLKEVPSLGIFGQ
ncbi:helix-turn-helix domain-containing protein [Nonomuraea sp. NPDC049709]|uniref:helix-turn-helix domain-containing protein n=1 Tax=Nonomuraea sp. NPDC049709 TaxID=3154736 RepID=UPI003443268F